MIQKPFPRYIVSDCIVLDTHQPRFGNIAGFEVVETFWEIDKEPTIIADKMMKEVKRLYNLRNKDDVFYIAIINEYIK